LPPFTVVSDLDVVYRLRLGVDEYADEEDISFVPAGELIGQVDVRSRGASLFRPEDELVPLVRGFCFGAVADLAATAHVTVPFFADYGYIRLDREAQTIRLSGDGLPDIRVTGRPFVLAAVSCGGRFLNWLQQTDQAVAAAFVEEGAAAARSAAERWA
jgi:hypothetical protein